MESRTKDIAVALAPALVAGIVALAATSLVGMLALRLLLQVVIVGGIVAMAWRSAAAIEHAAAEVAIADVKPVVLQRIAGDRRRPTFDRETGLLADWYFRLRVEEEIARAQRYGQKFTMLRITHAAADARSGISIAARTCLRAIDLAGNIGSTTCVLLPNTTRDASATVVDRLLELAPEAQIETSECPTEASTLAGLIGEQEWTTSEAAAEDEAAAA